MGQVVAPFGIKGWLRLKVFTESPDSLTGYPTWWLQQGNTWRGFSVTETQIGDKGLRAKLAEVDDRTAAEALRGCEVAIDKAEMPAAEEGEFYWSELIGLEVKNVQDERLGEIATLMESGGGDLLVVSGERERLIPTRVITEVDTKSGCVTVDWGLDY